MSEPKSDPDQFIDLKQLSELTSLSPRTLRAKVHDPVDPLPAYRVGTKLLFLRVEAVAFIKKHCIQPADVQGVVDSILHQLGE